MTAKTPSEPAVAAFCGWSVKNYQYTGDGSAFVRLSRRKVVSLVDDVTARLNSRRSLATLGGAG